MSRYMSNNFVVPVGFEPTSSHFKRVVHKNHSATRPLCDPDGIRTRDPNIKSVVLYQLSYKVIAELHGCVLRVVAFKPTSVIPVPLSLHTCGPRSIRSILVQRDINKELFVVPPGFEPGADD